MSLIQECVLCQYMAPRHVNAFASVTNQLYRHEIDILDMSDSEQTRANSFAMVLEVISQGNWTEQTLSTLKDDFKTVSDSCSPSTILSYRFILNRLLELQFKRPLLEVGTSSRPKHWVIWNKLCRLDNRLCLRTRAALKIQAHVKPWYQKRHAAAVVIQRNCWPWIWKPQTKDGRSGLRVRILLQDLHAERKSVSFQ